MSGAASWEPATDAEVALYDALAAGDQEGYFQALGRINLLLPVSADAAAGRIPVGWGTWTANNHTHLLAFTSEQSMRTCLAQHVGGARRMPLRDLAAVWPNDEWWLAVNPGLPIEGYLPAWFVAQLARGDARLPGQRSSMPRDRLERVQALERAKAAKAAALPREPIRAVATAGGPLALPPTAASPKWARGPASIVDGEEATAVLPRRTPAKPYVPEPYQAPPVPPPVDVAAVPEPYQPPPMPPLPTRSPSAPPEPSEPSVDRWAGLAEARWTAPPAEERPAGAEQRRSLFEEARPRRSLFEERRPAEQEQAPARSEEPLGSRDRRQALLGERLAAARDDRAADQRSVRRDEPQAAPEEQGTGIADRLAAYEQRRAAREERLGASDDRPGAREGRPAPFGQRPASGDRPQGRDEQSVARGERVVEAGERLATYEQRPAPGVRPASRDEQSALREERPLGRESRPQGRDEQVAAFGQGPVTGDERALGRESRPQGRDEQAAASGQRPVTRDEQAAASVQRPVTRDEQAAASAQRPVTRDERAPGRVEPKGVSAQQAAPRDEAPKGREERAEGRPRHAEPEPEFVPANAVEEQLYEASEAGNTDAFLSTLLLATVFIPKASGTTDGNWRPQPIDGEPHIVSYTSTQHLAEPLETIPIKFVKLISEWPDPNWSFAVNPGTPVGATLPGGQLLALANWAAEVGLGGDDEQDIDEPSVKLNGTPVAGRVSAELPILQKAIAPSQVGYYLERGYDRVTGFVHRAHEVGHLKNASQMRAALGLDWEGSPFSVEADEIYLLRWSAHRPSLYRIPYGGQNEQAMHAMQGWVIERAPFRGNGFAPGETKEVIAEFKVDSTRLPHGARLLRLKDGAEEMVAVFDADTQKWLRTDGGGA